MGCWCVQQRSGKNWLFPSLVLLAGAGLRLWFIHAHAQIQGDSLLYGDVAANWLRHGIYGHTVGHAGAPDTIEPTLARLPGYPAFLALCFAIFGVGRYHPVLYVQAAIDLITCLLIGGLAGRVCGDRAGRLALVLAALCPFTANYCAWPLTETLAIFCVALGFRALAAVLEKPSPGWVALLIFSWSYSALLRPDGALLAVALWVALVAYRPQAWRLAVMAGVLSIIPFVFWTARNLRTFHLFQPLAPRYANDPGEDPFVGYIRWVRSFTADFTTTSEIYWNGNSDEINPANLPARAFDDEVQKQKTLRLLEEYNATTTLTPELDARFAELAAERARSHPFRYYVGLPLLRLADMWLRPRVETLNGALRWWQYSRHPAETRLALYYGALNLAYLVAAFLGARRRPRLLGAMLGFIVLRSLLLVTLEAPEARYTLECFPVLLVMASCAPSWCHARPQAGTCSRG
jgi:hypothetical protein